MQFLESVRISNSPIHWTISGNRPHFYAPTLTTSCKCFKCSQASPSTRVIHGELIICTWAVIGDLRWGCTEQRIMLLQRLIKMYPVPWRVYKTAGEKKNEERNQKRERVPGGRDLIHFYGFMNRNIAWVTKKRLQHLYSKLQFHRSCLFTFSFLYI